MKMRWLFLSSILLLTVSGCFEFQREADSPRVPVPEPPAPQKIARVSQYGMGDGLDGKTTANGEIFNPQGLTAAHRSLPFGTLVRVTEPKSGRSVVVRINDRGPFVKGREFDLSYAAARELGIIRQGVANVAVSVLD